MFYIIEKFEQLELLYGLGDCFINIIPFNDNVHPALQGDKISLIYLRSISDHKGYILCLRHNESLSLSFDNVIEFLKERTERLFTLNKKDTMYYIPLWDKLYDINFIKMIPKDDLEIENNALTYYYRHHYSTPNINCIVPISKHYELNEQIYSIVEKIIDKPLDLNSSYDFNNNLFTEAFYFIEKQGLKLDGKKFKAHYIEDLEYPEFNVSKGKIYTQYNLYTLTGRPSNRFNTINFAALNKSDGERECYIPNNDIFLEFDFQGYHPRLIGELVGFDFPRDRNTYDYLGELLGVTQQQAKELTFKQLYGGVWDEYKDKPFFKDVITYTDKIWDVMKHQRSYSTESKIFWYNDIEDITPQKFLNYIIQNLETSTNVKILDRIFNYLKDKKSKVVLYTYDAFLIDYAKEDGPDTLRDLQTLMQYPTSVKRGSSYHGLILL